MVSLTKGISVDTQSSHHRRLFAGVVAVRRVLAGFLRQDSGAFHSVELVLIGTIACIGLVVGLAEYRNSVVQEYGDVSGAIAHLDQSFSFTLTASSGGGASTFSYSDTMVYSGTDANGVTVTTAPTPDSE